MFFNKKSKISQDEAHRLMSENKDVVVLDVRTSDEYRQVHINKAKLLPVDEIVQNAEKVLPDKDAVILVYCHTGMRAARAVKLLRRLGYTNAVSFGGILDWQYGVVR